MSKARRTAVSYARFSTPNQSKGDSETRQEREYKAFCERHNQSPGTEVFIDRGRSGYHGTHRTKGALGVLVQAAKGGRFEPGTVIVVEAWDRLGRLRPDKQIELVSELLSTGVAIGVCRLNEIFELEDFGSRKWATLSVFISLTYNESKQKSDRLKSAWAGRRKRAGEGGKIGGTLPAWVECVRGEFRLIPERAAAVLPLAGGSMKEPPAPFKDGAPGSAVLSSGKTGSEGKPLLDGAKVGAGEVLLNQHREVAEMSATSQRREGRGRRGAAVLSGSSSGGLRVEVSYCPHPNVGSLALIAARGGVHLALFVRLERPRR